MHFRAANQTVAKGFKLLKNKRKYSKNRHYAGRCDKPGACSFLL